MSVWIEVQYCAVIRFGRVSAKFGTCTVVSVNETVVEEKMCTFTLESTQFIFNKCPTYTDDGARSKFSTNMISSTITKMVDT